MAHSWHNFETEQKALATSDEPANASEDEFSQDGEDAVRAITCADGEARLTPVD